MRGKGLEVGKDEVRQSGSREEGGSRSRYVKRKWGFRKEDITQMHISFHLTNHAYPHIHTVMGKHFATALEGPVNISAPVKKPFLALWFTKLLPFHFGQVRAASNLYNLLCCSQLQFSCISWVRRSQRGLQLCALVVNTEQFTTCIRWRTHTYAGR